MLMDRVCINYYLIRPGWEDDGVYEPVHILAARFGNQITLQLLIDKGADISAVDHRGQTAFHAAAARGYDPALFVLLAAAAAQNNLAGALLRWVDGYGRLAAEIALSGVAKCVFKHLTSKCLSRTAAQQQQQLQLQRQQQQQQQHQQQQRHQKGGHGQGSCSTAISVATVRSFAARCGDEDNAAKVKAAARTTAYCNAGAAGAGAASDEVDGGDHVDRTSHPEPTSELGWRRYLPGVAPRLLNYPQPARPLSNGGTGTADHDTAAFIHQGALAPDVFVELHQSVSRPGLFKGGVRHWEALDMWTPEHLARGAGSK